MSAFALGAAAATSALVIEVLAHRPWIILALTASAIANCFALWAPVSRKLLSAAQGAPAIEISNWDEDDRSRVRGFGWLFLLAVVGYAGAIGFFLWLSGRAETRGLREALVVAAAVGAGFPAGQAITLGFLAIRVKHAEGRDLLVWDSARFWRGGRTWDDLKRCVTPGSARSPG